jgi:hypothetical protein
MELMIALVILGLGLSALTGAISDSLVRTSQAEKEDQVLRIADGLMAQLGVTLPIGDGTRTGSSEGVDWTIDMGPYGSQEDRGAWHLKPERIVLTLTWRETGVLKSAQWRTLRPILPPHVTQ